MDAEQGVFKKLGEINLDVLKQVYTELQLPDVTDENKKENETYIRRMIVRHLSSDTVVEVEDEGLATFLQLRTFIQGLTKDLLLTKDEPAVSKPDDDTKKEDAEVETVEVKEQHVESPKDLKKELKVKTKGESKEVKTGGRQSEMFRNFPWKKDLKLKGTIGDPKDTGPGKVTYLSLIRQIEKWVKKEYNEEEICDAVIEGISSEQSLRSMLEGKWDLTVPKLRRFLRVHFEEKEATQVYKELTKLSQGRGQKVKEFVMDAIGLRDKILFASTEAGNRFNYPEELVRSTCWHTVVTGIRDDNVKNEVKAVLSRDPEDEELLESLNTAVSDEKERQGKFKEQNVKANLVEQRKQEAETKKQELVEEQKSEKKINPVVAELREIRLAVNEIKSVKDDVEVLKECVRNIGGLNPNGYNNFNNRNRVQFGCPACKRENLRAVTTVTSVKRLGISKRIAQTSRGCSSEATSSQN